MDYTRAPRPTHRASPPRDAPRVGDLRRQPDSGHGDLYCLYRFYDRFGNLLYVGRTNDLIRRFDQHEAGSVRDDGQRRHDRTPWWHEVATVTVEHFPPGTTEWEARAYERSQIELGTRYNRDHNPYQAIAEQREQASRDTDQVRRDQARALHDQHDGVTRAVAPEPHPGFPAGPLASPRPGGGALVAMSAGRSVSGPLVAGRALSGPLPAGLPRAEPIRDRPALPAARGAAGSGRDQLSASFERRGGWLLWLVGGLLVGLALLAVAYYALPPR